MFSVPGVLLAIWLVFTITCFVRWVALALENERLAKEEKEREVMNETGNREADEIIKDFVNAILAAKSSER